ncbi:MAG TPA: glycosyltransferase family 9 protein [Longimicrobium sp.]|nr:glycosyltransferase family 9 protein [Longimicrobium sp.]
MGRPVSRPLTLQPGARVCIVLLTAVGDAVHALPVLNALKRHVPGIHLTWVIQPGPAGLVRGHPAVDELITFERKRGLRGFLDVRRELAGRRFDLVILLQPYLKAAVITGFARAPLKLGYDRARARDLSWVPLNRHVPPHPPQHIQDQYLEFLAVLGIPSEPLVWDLGPTVDEEARYANLLPPHAGPTLAFVVGTSKPEKEWPPDRYAAVTDALAASHGARSILVGGLSPRENAAAGAIRAAAAHPPLDLRAWDLRRVVYLLSRADVLVSPDTGPLHAAVALGTPTVSLMGYTNPRRYGPYRRFHDLLLDAFGDPGEDYPIDAKHRPGRMERITADQVIEKVRLALERYPRAPSNERPPIR